MDAVTEKMHRQDQIVDLVDLAPSLFYLAGIETPEHMHGQNIFGRKCQMTLT